MDDDEYRRFRQRHAKLISRMCRTADIERWGVSEEVFARALHHMGNRSEREYRAYRTLFDLVVAGLPRPDLLLYLKAPVPLLLDRIHGRGRSIESGITAEYLTLLETFYDEWLRTFDLCPVLTIHTDDLDFVHKRRHMGIVAQRIQDKLAGKEEIVFPANGGGG